MKVGIHSQHEVATVYGDASVAQAAATMRDRHVGDLVVVKGCENQLVPIGMLTDRDIAIGVVGQGLKPDLTKVTDAMSTDLVMVNVDDELTDVLRTMSDKGVRRAPVIDDHGILHGIVSMDDLIGAIAAELVRVTRLIRRGQEHEVEKTEDVSRSEHTT